MAVYLDSSAAVKLIVHEPESAAVRSWLRSHPRRVSSALIRTEILRAVRRVELGRLDQAAKALRGMTLQAIDDDVLMSAAYLGPVALRSLDAIHLATALRMADELEAIVTYDRRMIEGARALGLPVASPA